MTDLQEWLRRYYAAFNEQRFADAADLYAADAELQHRPTGTPLRGPAGYVESARMAFTSFPDLTLEIVDVRQRGDTIVEVDLLATGTHERDWVASEVGTLKANGKAKRFRVRETLEIRAGKITFSSLNYNLQDLFGSGPL